MFEAETPARTTSHGRTGNSGWLSPERPCDDDVEDDFIRIALHLRRAINGENRFSTSDQIRLWSRWTRRETRVGRSGQTRGDQECCEQQHYRHGL